MSDIQRGFPIHVALPLTFCWFMTLIYTVLHSARAVLAFPSRPCRERQKVPLGKVIEAASATFHTRRPRGRLDRRYTRL